MWHWFLFSWVAAVAYSCGNFPMGGRAIIYATLLFGMLQWLSKTTSHRICMCTSWKFKLQCYYSKLNWATEQQGITAVRMGSTYEHEVECNDNVTQHSYWMFTGPLPTIGNSLKKQKSQYKFLWAYGSSWRICASLVGKGLKGCVCVGKVLTTALIIELVLKLAMITNFNTLPGYFAWIVMMHWNGSCSDCKFLLRYEDQRLMIYDPILLRTRMHITILGTVYYVVIICRRYHILGFYLILGVMSLQISISSSDMQH